MSDSQQINHTARRRTIPAAFIFAMLLLSACSNSREKAMAEAGQAQALLDAGRIAEAQQMIDRAIALRDDVADLHLLRARIALAARSPDDAFNSFNDALALDTGNTEALMGVAQLGIETGHLDASEAAADSILTLEADQPQALLVKGLHNILHHRYEAALKNADAILAKTPNLENGGILRARALAMLDRSPEALTQIEKTHAANSDSLAISRTLLELYRQKDDAPAMVQQFDIIRRYLPRDHGTILDETNTLYKMGQTARARAFTMALLTAPHLRDTTAKLTTNLWDEYDPDPLDARGLADIATKGSEASRKAVARHYLRHNNPDKALLALGSDRADDSAALAAQAAIAKGQVPQGLAQASAILGRDKTHCDALLAKAQADLIGRRYATVVEEAQLGNANCPQLYTTYVVLARAQEAAGDITAADRAYRAGVRANVQDSLLARIYAEWLDRRGKTLQAIAIARRLTKSAPALLSGWKLYGDLCTRHPDAGCTELTATGLQDAKVRYAVDRRPDEPVAVGLLVQLDRKRKKDEDGEDY